MKAPPPERQTPLDALAETIGEYLGETEDVITQMLTALEARVHALEARIAALEAR